MKESPRLLQLLQFHSQNPNDSFLLFALGKEHEKLGNEPQALEYYDKIVANDPDYVGVYYHLGKLLEKTKGQNEALQAYKSGIAVAKKLNDQHALNELAAAHLEIDDLD